MFWCCIYSSLKKQDWSIHLSFFCLCLAAVPIDSTAGIKMLYVFVDIQMDNAHFLDTIKFNFSPGQSLALVSTIQFVAALQVIKRRFCQTLCAFVCDSRVGESWRTQLLSLVFSILHKEYIFLYSTGIHTHISAFVQYTFFCSSWLLWTSSHAALKAQFKCGFDKSGSSYFGFERCNELGRPLGSASCSVVLFI